MWLSIEDATRPVKSRGFETNAGVSYDIVKLFAGYTYTNARAEYLTGHLNFMKAIRWARNLKNTLMRGVFPHEMSFLLELPWRNALLSPRKLAARLPLTATSRVLEVGAGSGFYSAEIARRISSGHLELLDLQPEMLAKARRKLEAEGASNVGYTHADAGLLPFKEESFDLLFLVTVLGEIADLGAFLWEAHRVLKPEGILSVSEHLPDPDFSSCAKVKSLVERAGFEFIERRGVSWSYTAHFKKVTPESRAT